nr:spermidine hydroxycinnamoyl transferase-like [Ipomoea batatas]
MVWVKASHVIKPCEDTPNVVMPSSDCDEIYSLTHNPIICFYRSGNPSIDTLKDSLSRALSIFYPFAGRLRWLDGGRTEIHCNAEGAVLLEAESDTRVDDYARRDFLPTPELRRLIPAVDYANTPLQRRPLLLAQLTRFACGGLGFGFAVCQAVVDGQSTFRFITTWARIARGEEPDVYPFLDRRILQLQHRPAAAAQAVDINQTQSDNLEERKKETSPLMLKLCKENIQKLKDTANKDAKMGRTYSRFEVVVAHIWRCATMARGNLPEQPTNAYITVEFRNRLKPPLPMNYFGKAILRLAATATAGELQKNPLGYAVSRIRQAIDKATSEYLSLNLAFYKQLKDISSYRLSANTDLCGNPNFRFTSWISLPLSGMDFGWGKEIYTGPGAIKGDGMGFIIPSNEDDGSLKYLRRDRKRNGRGGDAIFGAADGCFDASGGDCDTNFGVEIGCCDGTNFGVEGVGCETCFCVDDGGCDTFFGVGNSDCDTFWGVFDTCFGVITFGCCDANFGVGDFCRFGVDDGGFDANFEDSFDASFNVGNDGCDPNFGDGDGGCDVDFAVFSDGCTANFGVGDDGCDANFGLGDDTCVANFGAGDGGCDVDFAVFSDCCEANFGVGDGGCEANFGCPSFDASFDVGNDFCDPNFAVDNSDCDPNSNAVGGNFVGIFGGADLGDCLLANNFGAERGKWGTAKEMLKIIMEMRIVVTMILEISIIPYISDALLY